MSHHGLPEQVEKLRGQVESLKTNLDQTLQSFEDLNRKTTDLAQEARQVVGLLGEERPAAGAPWGLFLTLALGAGIVWLISPETITSVRDFLTAQYRSVVGSIERPAS